MTRLHKYIKTKTYQITRHNEAWELVNKYQLKYEKTNSKIDLAFAQTYLQTGINLQENL